MLAAAVATRLPSPSGGPVSTTAPALTNSDPEPAGDDDHDTPLRRLHELGDLHNAGAPTDTEFAAAKQALLHLF